MATLQVIVDDRNEVLGTLVVDAATQGAGAPEKFGVLAGPGQRMVEIQVDDSLSTLDPEALHKVIKADHLN